MLDGKAGLPYSKGLMATSIMAAGLPPLRAHQVAELIEERLHDDGFETITSAELRALAAGVLEDAVGARYAENYRTWQRAQDRTIPLIVLVGGATGVGKSTIATTVAARLGIVRIMSTDAIREVMRGIFTKEMMPTLHASSFDVANHLQEPPESADQVIAGFRRQVQAVSVGVTQLLRRAVIEGTDVIVEGAHLVPGFIRLPSRAEAIVSHLIVTVDDEATHRGHFAARASDARGQRQRNYLEHLADIRRVQAYIRTLAVEHGVPVVPSYSLDATVSRVMELVVTAMTDRSEVAAQPPAEPSQELPEPFPDPAHPQPDPAVASPTSPGAAHSAPTPS